MQKTNSGLLAYAKAQLGLPYWYGTYGQTATEALHEAKKKQYPDNYTAADFHSQYGKRVHDCVGIVKGYLWSDDPTAKPKYNASQDKSARGMYAASAQKGGISTFPGKPGQLVYKSSGSPTGIYHVGVYDGEGYVYEAKGHAYGVVKTPYKASAWQYWSQCPYTEEDAGAGSDTTVDTAADTKAETVNGNRIASGVTYTLTLPLLKEGDSGPVVESMQAILKGKGYALGTYGPNGDGVDGEFGAATQNAVEAFQEDNKPLEVDGEVGGETWAAMLGL